MKKPIALVACLSVAVLLVVCAVSQSKDEPKAGAPAGPSAEEMEKMMKAWMELSRPGPQHAKLTALAGEWDVNVKMFMGGPDGPAAESKGVAVFKPVLGGRFVEQKVEGTMMMPDESGKEKPTKFEGMGLEGYDNYKKSYVSTWADSMGTVILTSKGVDNPQKPDEVTFYGEMDEPGLGLHDRMTKLHRKMLGKDKFVVTMYDLAVGEDYKTMELTYTRHRPEPSK
jgi:hypothetical protein